MLGRRNGRASRPSVSYESYPDVPSADDLAEIKGQFARGRRTLFGQLLRRQRWWIALLLLMLLVSSSGAIASAAATQALVDKGLVQQSAELSLLFRNAVIAALWFAVCTFAYQRTIARLAYQLDFDLRTWLFTRLQSADVRRLDTLTSGQVISRALTDVQLIEQAMGILPLAVGAIPGLAGLTIFLLLQNVPMGLLAAAALPINFALIAKFRTPLRALSWAEINERAEAAAIVDEPVRGMRVVYAFDRAGEERRHVDAVSMRVFRFAMARTRLLAHYDFFLKSIPLLVNALVLGVGISLVVDGNLTLGTLLLAFQLIAFVTQFSQGLDAFASAWQYMVAAQGRLTELLLLGRRPDHLPPPETDDEGRGGIDIVGVSLRLGGRQVLEDLDLAVAPGELVVLRGSPGSGKTTIASVAAGMLVPDAGAAMVAGVDVRHLGVSDARRAVLVASEVPFFFAGTLRENLDLAVDGDSDDEVLMHALWAAGAEDVLDPDQGGLDATVGDRGLTLSGGQRQRVALARTLIHPPQVLVLDDAMSAVNPARELEILERIRVHAPQTALLCITRRHGPTTIADRVVDLPDPDPDLDDAPEASTTVTPPVIAAGALRERHLEVLRNMQPSDEDPVYVPDESETDKPLVVRIMTVNYRRAIGVTLTALVVLTCLRLVPNFLIGNAADLVDADDAKAQGWIRAGGLALVAVCIGAGSVWFRIAVQRYTQSVLYLLRRVVFHRLSRLGTDYYDREIPGKVAARVVYDLDTLSDFIQRAAFVAAVMIAQIAVASAAMILIEPSLSVLIAIGLTALGIVSVILIPRVERAVQNQRERVGEVTARFEEDFVGRRDVRLLGASQKRIHAFTDTAWSLRSAQSRVANLALSYGNVMQFLSQVMAAAVLVRAGNAVLALTLTVGTALTLNLLAENVAQPLGYLGQLYSTFLRARVSWRHLQQPFDEPILPVAADDPAPVGSIRGEIRFEHVGFRYPFTGATVLHDIDLQLDSGSAVALVGYTGAGKSSITKLLMRMYDPTEGRVLVDGRDVRELELSGYRRVIGVVPQDAFLFKGTIHSNIAYGAPDASRDEVEAAAREVGAYDVLARLEGGFDHEVNEEGRNLTGAQQQLVALARAWMAKPAIMVLDEATSALDASLERKVLEAVTRLDCTRLLVTHRESVVTVADHIVVLDAGRVVENGPPATVVGAGGAYDRLWVAEPSTTVV